MALTTKTDLCNFALSRLGIKRVTDVDTDTSKEATACALYWEDALEFVQKEIDWYSLWKRAFIYKSSSDVDDDYDYKYDLPGDFLKPIRIYPLYSQSDVAYRLRGNVLVTNEEWDNYKPEFDDSLVDTGTDTITISGHDFTDGDGVILSSNGTVPTGLTDGNKYFVVGSTEDTIQLSLTSGGSAIDLTGAGSGTSYLERSRAYLEYVKLSEDVTEFEVELRLSVAYYLSYLLTFELAGSAQLTDQMFGMYQRTIALARQKNQDSWRENEADPVPWDRTTGDVDFLYSADIDGYRYW